MERNIWHHNIRKYVILIKAGLVALLIVAGLWCAEYQNRWQSRICSYRSITTIKPVYSLQRHLDVWHVGASAKNALHCKVMRINARIRLCLHVVLSRCEVGTAAAE